MRLSSCITYVLAAVLVVPAGLMAAQQPCQGSGSAAMSKNWDFPGEATQLLSDVEAKSEDVIRQSDAQVLLREHMSDWVYVGDSLSAIRADVNAMGKDLCRLQAIRRVALPWQQREISRITPRLQDMATQTSAAIRLLNNSQQSYWSTNLPNDLDTVYSDALRVNRSVIREIQEARTHQQPGTTSTSGS